MAAVGPSRPFAGAAIRPKSGPKPTCQGCRSNDTDDPMQTYVADLRQCRVSRAARASPRSRPSGAA